MWRRPARKVSRPVGNSARSLSCADARNRHMRPFGAQSGNRRRKRLTCASGRGNGRLVMTRWFAGIGAALVAIVALSSGVLAQDYPTRTVRIIVPFPPGGTADAMPRIVADFLAKKWGQAVIIENRAGAGGNTGADAAFHSDPDGYTLFAAPPPPLVVNQNLYAKLPFDPAQFIPIAVMGKVPNAI